VCHVLREDVNLAEAVSIEDRARATQTCIATAVRVPRGRWTGEGIEAMPDGIGLLVLRGLLIRRVGFGDSHAAELLGEGDLLRPWQGEDAPPALPHTSAWRVLQPARVAVLDRRVADRFARYPELTGRLVARTLERSRNLAMNMAIVQHARVHIRLHMLFWHLSNRWGYVRPDGVVLPLRLTHTVLAELVAARRPTVSRALSQLASEEHLQHIEKGWLLLGEPPRELTELHEANMTWGDI
jgi:CRP-like cAMP-binding protein